MKRVVWKVKYLWHSNRFSYHKQLMDGCLSDKLRAEFENKLTYHERKAISFLMKI